MGSFTMMKVKSHRHHGWTGQVTPCFSGFLERRGSEQTGANLTTVITDIAEVQFVAYFGVLLLGSPCRIISDARRTYDVIGLILSSPKVRIKKEQDPLS